MNFSEGAWHPQFLFFEDRSSILTATIAEIVKRYK